MIIQILGIIANISSLILWLPQARLAWKERNNAQILRGISVTTQFIALANTLLWCVYGILIHSFWLAIGTVFIAPTSLFILLNVFRSRKVNS